MFRLSWQLKIKSMKRIIHIHAKCDQFEIFEVIPERKAVCRLLRIRLLFEGSKNRFIDKLVVKTIVVNPELPFHA